MMFIQGRVRWLVVVSLCTISAIAYLDRVNVSVAGPSMIQEFGLTNVQLGWVFSAFLIGYGLFQAPGGRLADRFGPRRVIAWGTLWWAVFTLLTAIVPGSSPNALMLMLTIRFLLGVGEAVLYPASNHLIASWIPRRERGLANGLMFAGVGIGSGLAPPLVAYMLLNYGWRESFWMCAGLGVLVSGLWLWLSRDDPNEHPWTTAEERAYILAGMPAAARVTGTLPWTTILANRDVWALTYGYFAHGYCGAIFFNWFFIYLNTVRGLDLKASAVYSALPFLAMILCAPLGGWLADRLSRRYGPRAGRCGTAGAAMALCAAFMIFGTRVDDARVASIVLAGGVGALYLSISSFWAVTADLGGHAAGAVSSVMNTGYQIGGAITVALTPALAEWFGWTTAFAVAAAVSVSGAMAWVLVSPTRQLSQGLLQTPTGPLHSASAPGEQLV